MRRHSFFVKLFLGDLLLIGLIVGVGGLVSYRGLNATYLAESESHQQQATHIAQQFFQELWGQIGGEVGPINAECRTLLAGSPMRLTVIAADGRVLGDSEADPNTMENHKTNDRPEVMAAMAGRHGQEVHFSGTLGREFRYIARPIRHGGRVVGVARVAMPIRAIHESGGFIRDALLWAGLAAVAAAVALALLLSWLWYAPLRQITRTARTLASGDLSQRAAISGADELAQLGTALNEMRDSIAAKISQIANQRANLVAVVENLREGTVGLDSSGRIVLMNHAAIDLLAAGADDVVGKHLQAVVRVAEIVDVYNEVAAGAESVRRQIEADIHRRRYTLDVHAARLSADRTDALTFLLLIRDVTDIIRTAAIRAEFVANASHELRTPLATIRAAVDSLATIEPNETEEFRRLVDILDRHALRLENMTTDLLSLHAVETAKRRLRLEAIPLGSLAAWVHENYDEPADEKGITLLAEADHPDAELRCDQTLLQLILQNLLDNAVKFTPSGGRVECRLESGDDYVTVRIHDTGCGIPREMQGRVFERFFQADTARSGEPRIRGTGLGLAIVKHATERLGGAVTLDSEPNVGTKVTVRIPRLPDQGAGGRQ